MTSSVFCTKRVVLIAIIILQECHISIETTHAWENRGRKNGTLKFCYPDMRTQEIFLHNGTSQPLLLCVYSPNGPVDFVNINGTELRFNIKMDHMRVNNLTDDSRQMYYVSVMIENATLNVRYVGWLSSGLGEMLEFSFIYRTGQIRLCHYKPLTSVDVMLLENLNVTFCLQSRHDIHKYVGINGDICYVNKHGGHVYCHVTYDPNTGETYVGVGINDVTFDDVGYYVITIKNMKNERLKHLMELKLKEDQTTETLDLSVTTLITSAVIGVVVIFVIVLVCLVTHYKHTIAGLQSELLHYGASVQYRGDNAGVDNSLYYESCRTSCEIEISERHLYGHIVEMNQNFTQSRDPIYSLIVEPEHFSKNQTFEDDVGHQITRRNTELDDEYLTPADLGSVNNVSRDESLQPSQASNGYLSVIDLYFTID